MNEFSPGREAMKGITQQSSRSMALYAAAGILLVFGLSAVCLLPVIAACSRQDSRLVQKGVATPFHAVRRCDILPARPAINLDINFDGAEPSHFSERLPGGPR
jgi:hypothetical protein